MPRLPVADQQTPSNPQIIKNSTLSYNYNKAYLCKLAKKFQTEKLTQI